MSKPTKHDHPILIIIRGLPGSGKSYLADALHKELGTHKVTSLDPDATDYENAEYLAFSKKLTEENVDAKLHPYRFLRANAYKGIEANNIVIWNQAFTHHDILDRTIKNLQNYAHEHRTMLPTLVVEVDIEHDVAKERIKKRKEHSGRDVPEEQFTRFINDYATFADYGYKTITVSGKDDVAASVKTVLTAIGEL